MKKFLVSFLSLYIFSTSTISIVSANEKTNLIMPYEFEKIDKILYEDNLNFKLDEKTNMYGFIDKNGKVVIPYQFDDGYDFKEGIASVKKDGRFYYIDRTGKKIINRDFRDAMPFSEGVAAVSDNGKWGYIDKTGKEIIPLIFDNASDFKNGVAEVKKNGKTIYIDKNGNETFKDELFFKNNEKGGYSFVNKKGKIIIPHQFQDGYDFKEGFASVKSNGRFYYIDKTGKKITKQDFRDALSFNEGLAPVRDNGKWGYIDFIGNVVIPFQFEEVSQFKNGIARVNRESITLIDIQGNILFNSDVVMSNEDIRSVNLSNNQNKKLKENELNLVVNEKTIYLPQQPIIENGVTLVPIRGIFEKIGVYVELDNKTNKVIVQKYLNPDNLKDEEKITIQFTLNSNKATVNGNEYTLPVAPKLVNGNFLVPIRFIADNLHINLKYNEDTKILEVNN